MLGLNVTVRTRVYTNRSVQVCTIAVVCATGYIAHFFLMPHPALRRGLASGMLVPVQRVATDEAKRFEADLALDPGVKPRPWKYIVLHHTATETGSVSSIDAVHRQRTDSAGRPWLGIGYHFVIGNGHGMPDGAVEATFRWKRQLQGAHAGVRKFNEQGIGVCLVGDFNRHPPTRRQLVAAERLVQQLARLNGIDREQILPHWQIRATACPGKLFPLDDLRSAVAAHPRAAASRDASRGIRRPDRNGAAGRAKKL